jgi:hypothetical protein
MADVLMQVLQPLLAAPDQLAQRQQRLCIEAAIVLGLALQVEAVNFSAVAQGTHWSREARRLLAFCVQHRQQWLDALFQAALLLNVAADGGPGGIQSWVAAGMAAARGLPPQQQDTGGTRLISNALMAVKGAAVLMSHVHGQRPVRQLIPGEQPPFAATPEGAAAVVEVSELLVRLAAKRAGLNAVLESRLGMNPLQTRAAAVEMLLHAVSGLLREDALKAPALVGTSRGPGEAEARLQAVHASVRSLAASASKLVRLMPAIPAVETRIGGRHHHAQFVLELALALACRPCCCPCTPNSCQHLPRI